MGQVTKAAELSPDRMYRYTLTRSWPDGSGTLMVVGLNPSTADETEDDPTIRRCVRFAQDWGFSGLVMTNLFAYRATDPRDLARPENPVGTYNDEALQMHADSSRMVLAAWGSSEWAKGPRMKRVLDILTREKDVYCLKKTKDGHPWHPLYVAAATVPQIFKEKKC